MKDIKMGTYVHNGETYNFNFATDLSAYKKMMFVNYVVNSVVDDNRYDSIIRDMIFDFGIVSIFTDIDTSFIHIKDDDGNIINPIIPIEQFLEETNVVDIVKVNMTIGLLDELNKAIDLDIEYRTGIHPNPLNEALANLMFTLEKKVNEIDLNSAMGMAQKLNDMGKDFNLENLVNAYMNSDIHKNNLEEIAETKGE